MTILLLVLLVTIGGPLWLFILGRRGSGGNLINGLAGGLGAGLGITWKFLLGFNGAGFLIESAFLGGGILAVMGAYSFGKWLHERETAIKAETFE